MSTTLYYPNKAAPTTTITMPDPSPLGVVAAPSFLTIQQHTSGGVRYAYEHAGPLRNFDLNFVITSKATFDSLVAFIRDDVRGPLNTFEANILGVDYAGCSFNEPDFTQALQIQHQCASIEVYPVNLKFQSE